MIISKLEERELLTLSLKKAAECLFFLNLKEKANYPNKNKKIKLFLAFQRKAKSMKKSARRWRLRLCSVLLECL